MVSNHVTLNRDFQWAIRDKQSLLRARFLHLIMKHAWSGNRTTTSGMPSRCANHYTTAPLYQCDAKECREHTGSGQML